MKIGILGAGLSGISLAYHLQDSEQVEQIELPQQTQPTKNDTKGVSPISANLLWSQENGGVPELFVF